MQDYNDMNIFIVEEQKKIYFFQPHLKFWLKHILYGLRISKVSAPGPQEQGIPGLSGILHPQERVGMYTSLAIVFQALTWVGIL